MKGRAASTMVGSSTGALSIGGFQSLRSGGAGGGTDSQSGSYIPPSLLARLRNSDSVESSAGTSPVDSHVPFQPPQSGLGFGLSNRTGGAGASGQASTSRFGAPQLVARGASPAPYAQSSMNLLSSSPSAPSNIPSSLQRRPSVFLLGSPLTGGGNNIPPMLGSTPTSGGSAGARSISTRNLLSQPSPLHQRSLSRSGSRAESRSGSGRNTPKAPATPRGGAGPFGPGTPRLSAASSRHVSTSGIGIGIGASSGIPTSPLSGGSNSGQMARMGPRSFSPFSGVGLSQTPVSPGWMHQQPTQNAGASSTQTIAQSDLP
jgi:hypothetical protein